MAVTLLFQECESEMYGNEIMQRIKKKFVSKLLLSSVSHSMDRFVMDDNGMLDIFEFLVLEIYDP